MKIQKNLMGKELDIMNKTELEIKSILDDMNLKIHQGEHYDGEPQEEAIDLIKQEIGYEN